MAEKSGGFVSAADSPSSNPLSHLDFRSNSDSNFLLLNHPNIEPSCGNNSEEVVQLALYGHPSSACAMAEKSDGSAPAGDCRLVKSSQASFSNAVLTKAVRDFVSVWDSLRVPADGGNEGIVEGKNDEAIGIDASPPSSTRGNVVEIEDEIEKDDLVEDCAPLESVRDEIQHKSPGTLNDEAHQVNCKSPKIGDEFSSEEEAYEFYNNYARNIGFRVRKGKVQRLANGDVRKKYFFCTKEGFRSKKQSYKTTKYKRKETRIGCEAMIQFTIENKKWVVSNLILGHNHDLVSPGHKHVIIDSVKESGTERDAAHAQNLKFHGMDCNDFCHDTRTNSQLYRDVQSFTNYLESFKLGDPSFFYKVGVDAENCATNFFWRDKISKNDYDFFGDVLILDTTIRMDIYNMICAPFVGVNHHQQYILLGCAFLLDETTKSFIWLFETFMESMGGCQPKTIFTDDRPALADAIGKVLPETQHRLCMWHICQNAAKHLSDSYMQPGVLSLFSKCIFDCQSKENFQLTWDSLLDQYNLHENSWLQSLYMLREKWSHVFSKKTFSASIESVRSGEGINDFFHHLTSETMTLTSFAQQYEKEAEQRRLKELSEDLHENNKSLIIVIGSLMEKHAANIYTRAASKLFREKLSESCALAIEEIARGGTVVTYKLRGGYNSEYIVAFNCSDRTTTCSCKNFESTGILCGHALKVLNARNISELPVQYILKRWTKFAKEREVNDHVGETSAGKRKRSLSSDNTKLMHIAFNLITKCGSNKDSRAIAEQYLKRAVIKVNGRSKRKKCVANTRKIKEREDVEDNTEVAGSNTSGFGCSETQRMVMSSPCHDPNEIWKSRMISEMKKRSHQPGIKVARDKRDGTPSTGSSTRISSSEVQGHSRKHANSCPPHTQTPSTSTFHQSLALSNIPTRTLLQLLAPPNVPTRTLNKQGNLEKDKSSQVLVQTNPMPPIPLNDKRKPRACTLALGSIDRVVAHGYMHEEGDSNLLHRSIFSKENARVSIDSLEKAEYGSEHLPIPTPDAETLMEAVKGFVAWPRHLVILKTSVAQEKAPLKQGNFDIVVNSFAKLVDKATKQTPAAAIYVMVDREVFRPGGPVSDIPVFRDELLDLINFKEIGVTIMKLYMCALYNKAKEVGVDHTIRFAAPAGLRGYTKTVNIDQLHDTLETAESEQYFLYPYNIGFHWVLAIIDPQKRHTLYLDPLDNELDGNIVNILLYACKSLDYNLKFTASKKKATFEKVKCPKQPGSVECGYYVMSYMKDVIDSHGIHPAKVFNNNECYGRDVIDEVRIELMNFIRDNMR